ncbi:MAG: histidine phosphatase family protein, partial [Candidatus Diapherotrites archaeon]|nr:histidine phosphatase family protein [Candidatus Diapherotrites archaeon]
IAFPGQKIVKENDLREREYGVWEGRAWKELKKRFPKEYTAYKKNRQLDVTGAEPLAAVKKRCERLLQKIQKKYRGKTLALIGHGLTNKVLLAQALGWSDAYMATQHQTHGNVSELMFDEKKWRLKTTRQTNHLENVELPMRHVECKVKRRESKTDFKSHAYDHVHRVAKGAKWFAKILGQSRNEQDLAYIAGLVHDLGRPKTEKIDHTQSSIELATKMLKQFSISEADREHIIELVAMHRQGDAALEKQTVFLADKLWEQMGAYVVFRRAVFCAEVSDYAGWDPIKANIHQNGVRLKKFSPNKFPKRFRRLAKYQYAWPVKALKATRQHKAWILELIQYCAAQALKRGTSVDSIIKRFRPKSREGKRFQKEAILYITGKKLKTFEGLTKQ